MANDANIRGSDARNYQIPSSVSLFYRPKGSVLESEWKDLGNIIDPGFIQDIERLEHFSNRRGERAKDRSIITGRAAQLDVTIDEINLPNLQVAFGSKAAPTAENAQSTKHDLVVKNPGGAGVISLGMPNIKTGSVIVRSVSLHVADITYVVTTDYTVSDAAGTVTIVGGGALNLPGSVPEIHIFWEKEVDVNQFEIVTGEEIEVELRLQVFTPGGLQWALIAKNALIKANGTITLGNGDAFQQVPLTLEILRDSEGKLAVIQVLKEGELTT